MTDSQRLLAEYVQAGSESAFRELVTRYVDFVYSIAIRLVDGDVHRAKDVAQTVFVDLTQAARTFSSDAMLGGWLHRHTCFVAAKTMRGERRRQNRERQAVEMHALQNEAGPDFKLIAPLLDEAINELADADRTAILLRFFEHYDFRSVGEALGSNEDAARMRVNRALEKLQELLKRRGLTSSAAALSVVLSANAVQAAPVGLALTISTAAVLTGTTLATTATVTATKAIAMTALQKTIVTATIAVLAGAGIYEARQAEQRRDQVQTLQQQQAPLAEQIQQLQRERDEAKRSLQTLADAISALKGNSSELLKLRGEVARLRGEANAANDPFVQQALTWKAKAVKLAKLFEDRPDQRIPELGLLNDDQWFSIAKDSNLDTESGIRNALSELRSIAEQSFAANVSGALPKFSKATGEEFPTELSQLQPYFDSPVDVAILQRWKILPAGSTIPGIGGEGPFITEKAAVDELFDRRYAVMKGGGYGVTDFLNSEIQDIMMPVYQAYNAANNDPSHFDFSQLLPYATTPEQQAAVQKLIQQAAAKK